MGKRERDQGKWLLRTAICKPKWGFHGIPRASGRLWLQVALLTFAPYSSPQNQGLLLFCLDLGSKRLDQCSLGRVAGKVYVTPNTPPLLYPACPSLGSVPLSWTLAMLPKLPSNLSPNLVLWSWSLSSSSELVSLHGHAKTKEMTKY